MMRLFLLACLTVLCAAQPSPPNVPNTFTLVGEVERHRESTVIGMAHIAYSMKNNMGVMNFSFPTINEEVATLERYDKGMTYLYRRAGSNSTCQRETVNGSIPGFFDWVGKCAEYAGEKVIRHITYDFWVLHGGLTRLELHVPKGKTNPAYLNMQTAGEFLAITVKTFDTGEPDVKDFTIPKDCV